MNPDKLAELLSAVKAGQLGVEEAVSRLRGLPFEDIGFAKIDTHRSLRVGFPEVVYCEGKTDEQVAAIMRRLADSEENVLATRAGGSTYALVKEMVPEAEYHEAARMIVLRRNHSVLYAGTIAVVSGGTSDIPVAEEAAITAEVMGNAVERIYDVGVAGLHRLLGTLEKLQAASVIIAVAGMEGALPSVVGGLVASPVIGVPTSVGYGANFQGLAPLLTMLNSCAAGVCVVNIGNGFGAGYLAALINRLGGPGKEAKTEAKKEADNT